MPAQTQTRQIIVSVDSSKSQGLRDIAKQMGLLNQQTKTLSGNMGFLTSAFQSWLGYLGVRELTRMSDEVQNITNRLKITAKAGEDTAKTFQMIQEVADRTNQSLESVGTIYSRLSISLNRIGANSGQVIALTETLVNSFRAAGATAAETTNTIIQLSQAFSSGEIRGQELRSVMEQNAVVAQALQEKLGGNVYKKAADGLITVTTIMEVLRDKQAKINADAQKLAPTFEQVLTKATNKLSVALGELNQKFGLSTKALEAMNVVMNNFGNILLVVGTYGVAKILIAIPNLIAAISALRIAATAFAVSNPLLLAFTALAGAIGFVIINYDKLTNKFRDADTLQKNIDGIKDSMDKMRAVNRDMPGTFTNDDFQQQLNKISKIRDEMRNLAKKEEGKVGQTDDAKKRFDELVELSKKIKTTGDEERKLKDILGDVNKQYQSGAIDIGQYNDKLVSFELYKVNRQFKEGKFDVFEYNERLKDISINGFNRNLQAGLLTLKEYKDVVNQVNLDNLNVKLNAGKISLAEYNAEMIKLTDKFMPGAAFSVGINSYIESIGTLSQGIASGIEGAFNHLEDNLTEFIKTGTFNFAKFTQSILDDLTKIIIRASIVKPLADGILGAIGTGGGAQGYGTAGGGAGFSNVSAKGNVFDKDIKKFASGGIVNAPTAFQYGGGKTGLMGEAGPEAIVPLRRTSSGDLGVSASPTIVNVINNAPVDVKTSERAAPGGGKQIDIMIISKVQEGMANGAFDKQLKQGFGLARRGM